MAFLLSVSLMAIFYVFSVMMENEEISARTSLWWQRTPRAKPIAPFNQRRAAAG